MLLLGQEDRLERIELSAWLGRPKAFGAWMMSRVPVHGAAQAGPSDGFGCSAEGCAI